MFLCDFFQRSELSLPLENQLLECLSCFSAFAMTTPGHFLRAGDLCVQLEAFVMWFPSIQLLKLLWKTVTKAAAFLHAPLFFFGNFIFISCWNRVDFQCGRAFFKVYRCLIPFIYKHIPFFLGCPPHRLLQIVQQRSLYCSL